MRPKNFRAPTGIYWVHIGPWTDPDPDRTGWYSKGLGYAERGGGIFTIRKHAENRVEALKRKGYFDAQIWDSG